VERVRFGRSRASVLERYEAAVRNWKAERMAIEPSRAPGRTTATR
jgi:hypothetical protein